MVLLAPGASSKRAQQLLNRPTRLWCRCPDAQLPNEVASTAVSACLLLAGKALWLAVRLIWHNKFFLGIFFCFFSFLSRSLPLLLFAFAACFFLFTRGPAQVH